MTYAATDLRAYHRTHSDLARQLEEPMVIYADMDVASIRLALANISQTDPRSVDWAEVMAVAGDLRELALKNWSAGR